MLQPSPFGWLLSLPWPSAALPRPSVSLPTPYGASRAPPTRPGTSRIFFSRGPAPGSASTAGILRPDAYRPVSRGSFRSGIADLLESLANLAFLRSNRGCSQFRNHALNELTDL